jgi:two-component system chemotaxis response regulator CheY
MAISLHDISFLIVDDSIFIRRMVAAMLRGFGARTIYDAEDGADGLAKMETNAPDLIITDWVMPVLDGEEFVRFIRTPDSPHAYVPIIMLSGYSEKKRVTQASQMGINHFLCKPFSSRALYDRIVDCVVSPRRFVRTSTYFGPEPRVMKQKERKRIIGVSVDDEGIPIETDEPESGFVFG